MTKEEFIKNVMNNDREGIEKMTVDNASDILDWMRGDDENNEIPADLTAEEFAEMWNEIKGIRSEEEEEPMKETRTYLDVMGPDENLGWCKPYVDESGKYWMVVCEGKATSIRTPSAEYPDYSREISISQDEIRELAKAVNPDYDVYSGWSDLQIALERMEETGCGSCPWRFECDAMKEEVDIDEND